MLTTWKKTNICWITYKSIIVTKDSIYYLFKVYYVPVLRYSILFNFNNDPIRNIFSLFYGWEIWPQSVGLLVINSINSTKASSNKKGISPGTKVEKWTQASGSGRDMENFLLLTLVSDALCESVSFLLFSDTYWCFLILQTMRKKVTHPNLWVYIIS